MRNLLKIAGRNLAANARRTLLTLAAITLMTGVIVFFKTLQSQAWQAAVEAATTILHGHLQIQHPSYLAESRLEHTIVISDKLREDLLQLPTIKSITTRTMAFALLSSKERSFGVQLLGIEKEMEPSVTTLHSQIKSGSYLSDGTDIILGERLARNLRVTIGDEITLFGLSKTGSFAANVFKFSGVFASGNQELDKGLALVSIQTLRETFELEEALHAVVIKLRDISATESTATLISNLLPPNTVVHSWDVLLPGLKQGMQLDFAAGYIFQASLILVVILLLANSFLMSTLERIREFGTLLAIGASNKTISLVLLLECFLTGVSGIIAGSALGAVTIAYFGRYGFRLPGSHELSLKWNIPAIIYTKLEFAPFSYAAYATSIALCCAIIYPIIKISRLKPLEAMDFS